MDIKLRELRIKKNIGLNELAKKARIAPSYLSALERGLKTNPSTKTMNKIAEALGATVPEIFYNKDKGHEIRKEDDHNVQKDAFKRRC